MGNPIETWKAEKHGLDVWPDVLQYAESGTPMKQIPNPDLERMKWHGVFYRKRDTPGNYMMRIRLTGNELSGAQAKQIAYIAYEFGHGIVDITTRGNIQVQGLTIDAVPQAVERLHAVNLTAKQTGHDNIRNVFCHPFSGLDPEELIDTRGLCHEVAALFIDSHTYSDLPRKFNICMNGRPHHGSHYWTQDISFLACQSDDRTVMFQLLIGGTQGQNPQLGWHLPVLVAPNQVVDVTRTLLDLFREKGRREKRNKARLRYLIEQIGIGGVLEYLEQHLDFRLQPCISEPPPPTGYDELVGWFPQQERSLWTMGLCVPLGRLSWQQLEGLSVASNKWGDGQLRTTPEQGLAVVNIPTGFKDAAATDAAAHGLSVHADSLARNTVACTGKQFCNIAVTETKGQMFQLVERLRKRALTLHGIRIHMSGCPSSCAQHHTADIGLKGVRVRRLMGTREGFDVYLGGGVAGRVHLALPYKLGVDPDQLPQLIEDVIQEYYLKHKPGQTFSAYWRETLQGLEAAKVADEDYIPPAWACDSCGYHHIGEDPPVFCPRCAGLRREFARLDKEPSANDDTEVRAGHDSAVGPDGFAFAAQQSALNEGEGIAVEVVGRDLALFKTGGTVHAIDGECPHEGAPLGEGELHNGVVTCPWHGWTFNPCTGCSLDPPENDVAHYETKIEDGTIYVKIGAAGETEKPENTVAGSLTPAKAKLPKATSARLSVTEIIQETPDTKTFRLDNADGQITAHRPGQFVTVSLPIDGTEQRRRFTISSSPTDPQRLELTIKRNPEGTVSNYLHDELQPDDSLTVHGPQGGFFFDPDQHQESLVLVSAGSGITPMMSIARYLAATGSALPCTFIYGARSAVDIIRYEECKALAEQMDNLTHHVSLTQPPDGWEGLTGRIDGELLKRLVTDLAGSRYFLCGPGGFIKTLQQTLLSDGVPEERIHTEAFHSPAGKAVQSTS